MMFENLPFPRGSTFFNGNTVNTTDGANLEGKEYIVDDPTYNGGPITLRIVRNVGAAVLNAKRLVRFKAGKFGSQVDGYARLPTEKCYPVDDQYGTATIPISDLFYIVVEGACLVKTSLSGDAANSFSEGDVMVNATAATSGATTSGRMGIRDFSAATTLQLQGIIDRVGRAMTARTTNNTDSDTLVMVGVRF